MQNRKAAVCTFWANVVMHVLDAVRAFAVPRGLPFKLG